MVLNGLFDEPLPESLPVGATTYVFPATGARSDTWTAFDVVCAPWLSYATAVRSYSPAGTSRHDIMKGEAVTAPTSVPLAKYATLLTLPSASVASARTR